MELIESMRGYLDRIAKRIAPLGVASRKTIERFLEYGISTGIATSIEFFLLYVLVSQFDMNYLWAAAWAFFVKVTILFALAHYTAFRDKRSRAHNAYLKFFGIYLINLCLILAFMKLAVDTMGMNYLIARVITLFFMVFWSFYANSKFNYKTL